MRRLIALAPLAATLVLAACADGTTPSGDDDDTNVTDTDVVAGDEFHPLVPEDFKFLWNTEQPCKRRNGSNGLRVYRLTESVTVDANGTFSAVEKWYFFHGDRDRWDEDAVDTLSYAGATSNKYTGAQLSCEGCEEIYEVKRTVEEKNSTGQMLRGYAEDVVFAFDNMNPNGGFQEDQKMFVFYGRYGRDGNVNDLDTSYAKGWYYPDSGTPGEWPATYQWGPFDIQGKCY